MRIKLFLEIESESELFNLKFPLNNEYFVKILVSHKITRAKL